VGLVSDLTDAEVQAFFDRANGLTDADAARVLYADWAGHYDRTVQRFGRYLSPERIAEVVAGRCPDRDTRVLDVACGTGMVGQALAGQGYRHLTGLDLSQVMLDAAGRKGLYARLVTGDVAAAPALGRFDVVVCAGALTLGHLGVAALEVLVGWLEPGGLLVADVEGGTFVGQGFDAALAGMVADGRLRGFAREEGHFYAPAPDEPPHGWFVRAWRGA
jgi:predicted TPR repeat methyltransferase